MLTRAKMIFRGILLFSFFLSGFQVVAQEFSAEESKHLPRFISEQIQGQDIWSHLVKITGVEEIHPNIKLQDRHTDENKAEVRSYIRNLANSLGYTYREEFFVSRRADGETFKGVNVLIERKGLSAENEWIEIVAHYDTAHDMVVGADDNGSGVSATLAMMQAYKDISPKRSIRFVFSDLEEKGLLGSALSCRTN
jgi:hypothetical protein